MIDVLTPAAAESGYRPDCVVTPDDVAGGRPHPWMIFQNAIHLQIDHLSSIVKIGDTIIDIEGGLKAGVWTIGVAVRATAVTCVLQQLMRFYAPPLFHACHTCAVRPLHNKHVGNTFQRTGVGLGGLQSNG